MAEDEYGLEELMWGREREWSESEGEAHELVRVEM